MQVCTACCMLLRDALCVVTFALQFLCRVQDFSKYGVVDQADKHRLYKAIKNARMDIGYHEEGQQESSTCSAAPSHGHFELSNNNASDLLDLDAFDGDLIEVQTEMAGMQSCQRLQFCPRCQVDPGHADHTAAYVLIAGTAAALPGFSGRRCCSCTGQCAGPAKNQGGGAQAPHQQKGLQIHGSALYTYSPDQDWPANVQQVQTVCKAPPAILAQIC